MKKLLIILLIIPVLSNGQTLQGYSGRYFKAIEYFNSPIYKLSGVDLDSANTVKKGFFTKFQYNKLQSAKQKNDSIINSGFATNYKLSLLYPTSSNTLYGKLAGHSISSGTNNVLVGYRAGYLVSSGTKNVMIGHNAGDQSTAVNYCTFVGNNAGYNTRNHSNTFIGAESGYNNRTGANNTFIGFNSGYSNYFGSGSIMIGYKAGEDETGSNKLYIENSNADSTTALVFGNFLTNKLVFNGNVGIGTVIPNKQLHIVGDSAIIRLENADEYGFYWDIYKQKIDESLIITSTSTNGFIGINKINPSYTLDVKGSINGTFLKSSTGIQVADDSDSATSANVGTIRYRTSGNNSYCEMCMQTGASTYAWVVIKTNSW